MGAWLRSLADRIATGTGNELATEALRGVPGLPPVLQTVHLLGAAVLMGSAVLFLLRVNGLAMRSWPVSPLGRRLLPWMTGALAVMPLAMLPFLLARPHRYLLNPVFGIKMGLLLAAVVMTVAVFAGIRTLASEARPPLPVRLLAIPAVLTWLLTVIAGRWIAYSDYLFWPA
ncbi:MAG: DUF6644 family protein [Pseudohongiellaceae bacterium]